jgi:hypothetical protein
VIRVRKRLPAAVVCAFLVVSGSTGVAAAAAAPEQVTAIALAPNLLIVRASAAPRNAIYLSAPPSGVFTTSAGSVMSAFDVGNGQTEFKGSRSQTVGSDSISTAVSLPTGTTAGTYQVGSGAGHKLVLLSDACNESGTMVIHDAAWSGSTVERLSASITLICSSSAGPPNVHVEIRYREPDTAANRIGAVTPQWDWAAYKTVTAGSWIDIPITVTNFGTAPVKVGKPAPLFQPDPLYDEWSVTGDLCTGVTLAPGEWCTFNGHHLAIAFGDVSDDATFVIPDGQPIPPSAAIHTATTALQGQPVGVGAFGKRGGGYVYWTDGPTVDPRNVLSYDIFEVQPNGEVGVLLARVANGQASSAAISHLADHHTYRVEVRMHMVGGTNGPLSAPVTFTTQDDLLFANTSGGRQGVVAAGLSGVGLGLSFWRLQYPIVTRLAASTDGAQFAFAETDLAGDQSSVSLAATDDSTAGTVISPTTTPQAFDTAPAFQDSNDVLFARSVSGGPPALERYDIATGTTSAVIGGAGLTDPAANYDGSIVAVDTINDDLVRLAADGAVTAILNTAGGTQPTVALDGHIAFVLPGTGGTSTISIVSADGSSLAAVPGVPRGLARTPSFSADGRTLYVAVAPTSGDGAAVGRIFGVDLASGVVTDLSDVASGNSTAPVATSSQRLRVATTGSTATVYVPDAVTRAGSIATSVALRLTTGDVAASSVTDGVGVTLTGHTAAISDLQSGATYTATAFYTDASGNAVSDGAIAFVAGAAPQLTVSGGPAAGSIIGQTGPSIAVTGDDQTDSITCTLDGIARACPGGVLALSNLATGTHNASFVGVNTAGSGLMTSRTFKVDRIAPSITVPVLPPLALATDVTVKYRATDVGAGVANYDVRRRTASLSGAFSAYTSPRGYLARTAVSLVAMSPAAGSTLCLSVRGRDRVGNLGAWSPDRCTTRPVDDRALVRSKRAWMSAVQPAFWLRTSTNARNNSAKLSAPLRSRGQVWIIAETCAQCGSVQVYAGKHYLGTVSLRSGATHYKVVLKVARSSPGGQLSVVTTSAKLVAIDGLGILAL